MDKNIRLICAMLCLIVFLMAGCSTARVNVAEVIGTDNMKTDYYTASFVIDETDLVQLTTYSSYVFVAEVVSYEKTEYLNNEAEHPITFYSIRVLENIKGKLRTDEDIILTKAGGIVKGSDTFLMCWQDILPEPGKTYLFAAVLFQEDLYCPMPNMVVEIDSDDENWLENEIVKQYIAACEKEDKDVPNGNRFISKYDIGE